MFKYNQKVFLRHYFAKLMIAFIKKYYLDIHQFQMIIPIPLAATRLRERGYNQSQLLATILSKHYNITLSFNNLIKIYDTKPQALLSQKERWTNIHKAFKIKNSNKIKNKNILIIDDLLTTGATTSQAAGLLKESGANIVGVLTLAIAP